MTRTEQEVFVKSLTEAIATEMVRSIREGKVPENWDGHELRFWLKEKAEQSANMSTLKKDRRRRQAYQRTCWENRLT